MKPASVASLTVTMDVTNVVSTSVHLIRKAYSLEEEKMSEIVGFTALSHSPFWNGSLDLADTPGSRFVEGVRTARNRIADAAPDVIVVFGPDHYRNFFLDVMPSFCVSLGEIVGVGDYGTHRGPIRHRQGFGRAFVDGVRERAFDPATSVRMGVDHGIVQPYTVLGVEADLCAIMIDCGADPRPSFRRSYEFGVAVGDAIRALPGDERVFIVGSGGLSHWVQPMSIDDETLADDIREYLIDGRERVAEYSAGRDASLAARIEAGVNGRINADWDAWFLDRLAAGDLDALTSMSSDEVEAVAGNGAHEVRTWLAAAGAWNAPIEVIAYETVPSWVTGMGVVGSAR